MQMWTILKLLGEIQLNYWGDISSPDFGTPDLNKHRKAVRGAAASTKMTNYFVTAGGK